VYAVIGWIVVKGVRSYVNLKDGAKPKYVGAGVVLVGGVAAAWIAQKKSDSSPSV
jgi:hypothetical protein